MLVTFDAEYQALHREAVWTDRSKRDARLEVRGPDAVEWLHGLLTQDVKALQSGRGTYAAYLTPQGRMVADMRVFHRGDAFLLETVGSARATLLGRLEQFVVMEDVAIADVTDSLGCLTVIGPGAVAATAACTGLDPADLTGLAEDCQLPAGPGGSFVAASLNFGEPAFDLFGCAGDLGQWRDGLQARIPAASDLLLETARIETGRPRYGVDMHQDTIPLEAGIETRAISFGKGCYVGQEVVIRILHRGQGRVARRLVWVEGAPAAPDAAPWRPGDAVHLCDRSVGTVSSACWSPARGGLLGVAMLHRDAAVPGTVVGIGTSEATVRQLP